MKNNPVDPYASAQLSAFFRSIPAHADFASKGELKREACFVSSTYSKTGASSSIIPTDNRILLNRNNVLEAAQITRHVIHVIKHCGYANGNVHVAVDLACVQADAGYSVTFVSAGGTFVELLKQHGVVHVKAPHEQYRPWDIMRAAHTVTRLVKYGRAEIIHAHMMNSAVVGYIASRITGTPLVTTVHNSFDRHSVLMRLGDKVVAVSEAERASLLAKGYSPTKLSTVMNAPNRSPRDSFLRNEQDPVLKRPCIVAANALHRRKGVFDLIKACRTLLNEYPTWSLYIAGEGPDREELEQTVRSAGLEDRVTFLGFLANPRSLMLQSDIFVLASYADPCSLAIGEARSTGCAIVATHVGGTPEMLEFGRAGRLVAPGRPDQLIGALRGLMRSPQERNELANAAFSGSQIFDVGRLLLDYEEIYQEARLLRQRQE